MVCTCSIVHQHTVHPVLSAFLDDITNLRDPQLFMHLIQAELNARTKKDPKKPDPVKNPSYVASVVANRWATAITQSF